MIIYPNHKRTQVLLRVRRLLTIVFTAAKPDWPEEAIQNLVNQNMAEFKDKPMRVVRLALATLRAEVTKAWKEEQERSKAENNFVLGN